MGRCTATRGQRRIGRTIRKLENSVELSSNECKAKIAEQKYKKKTQKKPRLRWWFSSSKFAWCNKKKI